MFMRQIVLIITIVMLSAFSAYAQYSGEISVVSAQAIFLGERAGDLAGHHVAIVPDLNNDGYDELLITAPLWDLNDQSASQGRVYLFYGKSQGWSDTINLADANALFTGTYSVNEASHDAFGIGDINNDGYNDLAISIKKTQAPQGGSRLGKVYLFFGKAGKFSGEISLEDADASIVGDAAGAEAAHVMGVGDLDKDGYDDFIIGAGFYPQVGAEAGKIYIFFGKPRAAWAKNADMETTCDASFLAENTGDWAGHRVSGLGDVNGDGFADLLISSSHRNVGDISMAGTVYLILGKARQFWGKNISLSQADASWVGETAKQNLGWNVARVGDVDGDGLDDILFSNSTSTYYLIPAKNLTLGRDIPISSADATVFSHSSKVNDSIGHDITGMGDINFDGFDDFLIGNSLVNDPVMGTAAGKSYLFMGRSQWPATVAMTSAQAVFIGEAANDESGFSVGGHGDVNGDGINDFVISAYKNDRAGIDAGAAYLFLTPALKLTLLFPNGGETLVGGQSTTLRWTPDPKVDFVTLEYSTNNGGEWLPIAENIADSGSFLWNIPYASSENCLVRVSDAADGDPMDISNSVFTISSEITLRVIAPNGSEQLLAGAVFPIRWTSFNVNETVKIEYSIDSGLTWDMVAAETPNNGSYDWLVPERSSTLGLVRISSAASSSPSDESDNPFTIVDGASEIARVEAENVIRSTGYTVEERSATSNGKDVRLTSSYSTGLLTYTSDLPSDNYQIFVRHLDEIDGISTSVVQVNGAALKTWQWNTAAKSDLWIYRFIGTTRLKPGDIITLQAQRDNGEYCRIDYFEFRRTLPLPESVIVLSPNGGEQWPVGSRHLLQWTSEGGSGMVDIELSRNNGGTWETIADNAIDAGDYEWQATAPTSENCRIRVTDADGSPSDVSDAPFAIVLLPTLAVTSPNGSENWQIGTQYSITWTSEHAESTVSIQLSRNNGATWEPLATSAANSGTFSWNATAPASDSCLVRVASGATADTSDALFKIVPIPQPMIVVTAPNGGEQWEINTQHEITWTSHLVTGAVRVELSRDAGATWSSLTDDTPNNGSLQWLVSGPASNFCLLRISAQDGSVSDSSDSTFQIVVSPSLTLTSPNGGETWIIGNQEDITWDSQRVDQLIKIEASRDGGDSWESIIDETGNDGVYSWTVSAPASNRCLIRISAGPLSDVSDNLFEIKLAEQPQITVQAPNGGEKWEIGFPKEIRWSSQLVSSNVKIELSRDNGGSYELIESNTENDGAQQWVVTGPVSSACLVRLSAVDGSAADASDAPFSIIETPRLTIQSPNGGEKWQIGNQVSISWTSVSTSGAVKIQLSRDSGTTWTTLTDSTLDNGAYEWTVVGPASTTCLMLVLDVDGIPIDISDATFQIVEAPQITLTSPNGGEVWRIGEQQTITWTAVNIGAGVKIELSRDGGGAWAILSQEAPNIGSWSWTVTEPTSTDCLIRVASLDAGVSDVSDQTFKIDFAAAVTRLNDVQPTEFALLQNYPNPFNPETRIQYQLPRDGEVSIDIYNVQGTRVRTLVSGFQTAGAYILIWNGKDEAGHTVPSGIYFCRMTSDGFQATRRMLLAK
jgi:hypothetical protein